LEKTCDRIEAPKIKVLMLHLFDGAHAIRKIREANSQLAAQSLCRQINGGL
jgi:hypothetical protein